MRLILILKKRDFYSNSSVTISMSSDLDTTNIRKCTGNDADDDLPYHVIGAGVVGLVTAFYLNKKGHKVEVIDKNEKPCYGTSFANGGLVCQTSFSSSPPLFSLIDSKDLNSKITLNALDVNFFRFGLAYLKMRFKSALGLAIDFRKQDYLADSVELFDKDFRQNEY